jgi:hypothetical protein
MPKAPCHLLTVCILTLAFLSGCASQAGSNPVSYSTSANSTKYQVNLPSSLGEGSSLAFETRTSFPTFPTQIQVYKTIKPEITAEYVVNLGSQLDLSGEISQGNDTFLIQVGNKYLQVYSISGAIEYAYDYLYPTVQPTLPSPEEAEAIATDIVSKLGLIPDGVKASYQGYGESGPWPFTIRVGFKRTLDGKYFAGSGAKYEVRIGDKGEITRIFINPVKYTPLEMVALKPAEQAFEEMKNTKTYMAPMDAQKITIENVSLVYWLNSVMTGQDYIVPVYCFTGTCQDFSGKTLDGNFTGWAEALQ